MSNMMIPAVEVESFGGTRVVPLETRLLMNRKLFIKGVIDVETANTFLSAFMFLTEDSDDPVTIYINCPGGEVMSGLMIYDVICGSDVPVITVCTGMAASMGAILFAAGWHGKRYILPHGKVLIHEPLISDMCGGSASSVIKISKSLLKTRDVLSGILSEHTGRPMKEINAALTHDKFMDAEEAIKFGICDSIIDSLIIRT